MCDDSAPFSHAIYDDHRGGRAEALLQHGGNEIHKRPITSFYFGSYDSDSGRGKVSGLMALEIGSGQCWFMAPTDCGDRCTDFDGFAVISRTSRTVMGPPTP